MTRSEAIADLKARRKTFVATRQLGALAQERTARELDLIPGNGIYQGFLRTATSIAGTIKIAEKLLAEFGDEEL